MQKTNQDNSVSLSNIFSSIANAALNVIQIPIDSFISIQGWFHARQLLKKGYKPEAIEYAKAYLCNSNNFPFLSVGINGETIDSESLRILKADTHANMSALWTGQIRISRQWIDRFLENEPDMMLALQAQMSHEHCHHLYDNKHTFVWECFHPRSHLLNCWINECRNDVLGCIRAFGDDQECADRAIAFLEKHTTEAGCRHTDQHPSWAFRREIVKRGVFDAESIRLITEEAKKYASQKRIDFKGFSPKIIKEVTEHAEKFYNEDLSFCLKTQERKR